MSSQTLPVAEIIHLRRPADAGPFAFDRLPPALHSAAVRAVEIEQVELQAVPKSDFWLGVGYALAIETFAAACFLGLWRMWEILR